MRTATVNKVPMEDEQVSCFKMDFNGGGDHYSQTILPYNIINSAEALDTVQTLTYGSQKMSHFGYQHPVSRAAVTPVSHVMSNVYFVER